MKDILAKVDPLQYCSELASPLWVVLLRCKTFEGMLAPKGLSGFRDKFY